MPDPRDAYLNQFYQRNGDPSKQPVGSLDHVPAHVGMTAGSESHVVDSGNGREGGDIVYIKKGDNGVEGGTQVVFIPGVGQVSEFEAVIIKSDQRHIPYIQHFGIAHWRAKVQEMTRGR